MKTTVICALFVLPELSAFTFVPSFRTKKSIQSRSKTCIRMGLFDGLKDAFTAPALESSSISSERETPIDRWMGWNAMGKTPDASAPEQPANFVDAMDSANYVVVELEKPMGIIFEENDVKQGGIFVLSLKEGGVAEQHGAIKPGYQLVAVDNNEVHGFSFDDALGSIIDSTSDKTKLSFFKGDAEQLYGPTGASKEWLTEFLGSNTEPIN